MLVCIHLIPERMKSKRVTLPYGAYAHDVMVAMLVYQINPVAVGVERFSYANILFCSNTFAWLMDM